MQQRTLQECSRLYKQELQQQEQISLQVLDQVQESLSLLRTLYRSRLPLVNTEVDQECPSTELRGEAPAEYLHLTDTVEKDNEFEKQQPGISEQEKYDTLQTVCQRAEQQSPQLRQEENGLTLGVSKQGDTRRLVSKEEIRASKERNGPYERQALRQNPPPAPTSKCEFQRGRAHCHVQRRPLGRERRPHSRPLRRYMRASSSSPVFRRNGRISDLVTNGKLRKTPQQSLRTVLHTTVAESGGSTARVSGAPHTPGQERSSSSSTLCAEPQPRAPHRIEASLADADSRNYRLKQSSALPSDAPGLANVPNSVFAAHSLAPCTTQEQPALPSAQHFQLEAPLHAKEGKPSRCESCASRLPCSRVSASPLTPAAPAQTIVATASSAEQVWDGSRTEDFAVGLAHGSPAETESTVCTAKQSQKKQRGALHESGLCPCCKAREVAGWEEDLGRPVGERSTATLTTPSANCVHIKGKTACSPPHDGDSVPQNEGAASGKRRTRGAADPSLFHPVPITVNKSSSVLSKPTWSCKAATAINAQLRSSAWATEVVRGSNSDIESDGTSLTPPGTVGDGVVHEKPCSRMHSEAPTPQTCATEAHETPRKRWGGNKSHCYEAPFHDSCARPPSHPRIACERRNVHVNSENTLRDTPKLSASIHEEGGGTPNKLPDGGHSEVLPSGGRGGLAMYRRAADSLPTTLLGQGRRTDAQALQSCANVQREDSCSTFSQDASSPTRTCIPLNQSPQRTSVLRRARCEIHGAIGTRSRCTHLLHFPYAWGALVTSADTFGGVVGSTDSAETPVSAALPEQNRAPYSCAGTSDEKVNVSGGLRQQQLRARPENNNVVDFRTPPPPPSCGNRFLNAFSEKPLYADSTPPATSVPSRSTPSSTRNLPETGSQFRSTCRDSLRQSAARRLDDGTPALALGSRPWFSAPSNTPCVVTDSSGPPELPVESPPLSASVGASEAEGASPSQIRIAAAPAGFPDRAENNYCKTVPVVPPGSCNCTSSACAPLVMASTSMEAEVGGAVFPQKPNNPSSLCASRFALLSLLRSKTSRASSTSALPATARLPKAKHSEESDSSFNTCSLQAGGSVISCQPSHYSASPGLEGRQIHRKREVASKSFTVPRGEDARSNNVASGFHQAQPDAGCAFSRKPLAECYSHSCVGDHLPGGTDGEASYCVLPVAVTSDDLHYSSSHSGIYASACTGHRSKSHKLSRAARQHTKVQARYNGENRAVLAKSTNDTKGMPNAPLNQKAHLQNCVTTRCRWRRSSTVQAAGAAGTGAQEVPAQPTSNGNDGIDSVSRWGAELFGSSCTDGRTSESPSDRAVSHPATGLCTLPRRRKPFFIPKQMYMLYRIQPLQSNVNPLCLCQGQQYSQLRQEGPKVRSSHSHHLLSQHSVRGPRRLRGNCDAPEQLQRVGSTDANEAEEAQSESDPHNRPVPVHISQRLLTCCSRVQEGATISREYRSLAEADADSRIFVAPLFLETRCRVGTKRASNMSKQLSMSRLSTASTHAEDSASAGLSLQPGTICCQEKTCLQGPQIDRSRRHVPEELPAVDSDGNSRAEDTRVQRKGKSPGSQGGQPLRQGHDQSIRLSHAQVATHWQLGQVASHRCTPMRLGARPPSSLSCCYHDVTSQSVKEEQGEQLSCETPHTAGEYEGHESSIAASHQEDTAEMYQSGLRVKHLQGQVDSRPQQNLLRQMRTEQNRVETAPQLLPATEQPLTPAPELWTHCHAREPTHFNEHVRKPLTTEVPPKTPAGAIADVQELNASTHRTSFILKLAAAEATAILRHE